MNKEFISTENMPFCKGCGHGTVAGNIEKAFGRMEGLNPLDVVVVTDIGCIGIIDKQFRTHTVHGLHGRSPALAAGIAMGLSGKKKKVLALLGDGGATIGLQHIIEAAHRNINMTVIVHNNMLYGMTGGQPSGLTPCGFKTPIMPDGKPMKGLDLCKLVHEAGAPYARRLIAIGDFSDAISEAFNVKGFSFIEAMEICPSYGLKYNPTRKLQEIAKEAGLEIKLYENKPEFSENVYAVRKNLGSLFDEEKPVAVTHESGLKKRFSVILSGSAGEGIQSAAELLAKAAMSCGLSSTKKGTYPVTVGVGFSTSEVIISPERILFTGIPTPDAVIAVSRDGLTKVKSVIESMKGGNVFLDSSLTAPKTEAEVMTKDFRTPFGAKSAVLYALFYFLSDSKIIPLEALSDQVNVTGLSKKIDTEKIISTLTK
ncbi:2-oxoacid:acceptor oxidoreductase family protein [candidate division WOR-3 bacterium]|nr:2-oxoacid:acceptor oxidoreductase family protein [candidate division WOR-3 bacterium]